MRLYPLYHPAAALYTRSMLEVLRTDFRRIPELLALPAPEQPEPEAPSSWCPSPRLVAEVARERAAARAATSSASSSGPRAARRLAACSSAVIA